VIGDGERDLVLVLDWASHLEAIAEQPLWPDFVMALARIGRVLWFDMRGIGMSGQGTGAGARDLVAGSGIVFEPRGEHELKGVPDRWTLYAATS
jgi:hypothetical protein